MNSVTTEVEQSLRIVATKRYDDPNGSVSIGGWKGYLTNETPILLTVFDKTSQSKWTRLVEHPFRRNTLKVTIPRSSVHHPILTTAELLRENNSCVENVTRMRRFTVESSSTCVAITTQELFQLELLMSLCRCVSAKESKEGLPTKIVLEIERQSSQKAVLHLKRSSLGVARWVITVEEPEVSNRKDVFLLSAEQQITDFELPTEVGRKYHVEAFGLDRSGGNNICQGSTDFETSIHVGLATWAGLHASAGHPILTQDELRLLHQMAVVNAGQKSARCNWLYRNKKPEYFADIIRNHRGIMKPYAKDNSGDPGSPINSRLDGLFFMASVKTGSKTGEPIPDSAFGETRIIFPAEELLAKASNLYFTDFYCMKGKNHYVTLVLTRPGSETDQFCSKYLLSLNLYDRSNNPFLFYDSDQLHVSTKKQLLVEVFYTEELNILGCRLTRTRIGNFCKGQSTAGGVPKNPNCRTCNLPKSNHASVITTRAPSWMINC